MPYAISVTEQCWSCNIKSEGKVGGNLDVGAQLDIAFHWAISPEAKF